MVTRRKFQFPRLILRIAVVLSLLNCALIPIFTSVNGAFSNHFRAFLHNRFGIDLVNQLEVFYVN